MYFALLGMYFALKGRGFSPAVSATNAWGFSPRGNVCSPIPVGPYTYLYFGRTTLDSLRGNHARHFHFLAFACLMIANVIKRKKQSEKE
jgi:hypothetical protein